MKKVTFISLFILTHILFIFLQISKYNEQIKLSYARQKAENELKELMQKKQELTQNLCDLQKNSTIKKYAREKLCMTRVGIKQVKCINGMELEREKIFQEPCLEFGQEKSKFMGE